MVPNGVMIALRGGASPNVRMVESSGPTVLTVRWDEATSGAAGEATSCVGTAPTPVSVAHD